MRLDLRLHRLQLRFGKLPLQTFFGRGFSRGFSTPLGALLPAQNDLDDDARHDQQHHKTHQPIAGVLAIAPRLARDLPLNLLLDDVFDLIARFVERQRELLRILRELGADRYRAPVFLDGDTGLVCVGISF